MLWVDECATCCSHKNLEIHHRVPKVLGGDDSPNNLITLCEICHHAVHNSTSSIARKELQRAGIEKAKIRRKKVAAIMEHIPVDHEVFYAFKSNIFDTILSNKELSQTFTNVVLRLKLREFEFDEFDAIDQLKLRFVKYYPSSLKIRKFPFSFKTRVRWLEAVLYQLIADSQERRYLLTCIKDWQY